MRFLGSIRPQRLLNHPKLREGWDGCRLAPDEARVISVEEIGDGPVVALDTTTNTFIGEGLLQHNTTNYPERLDKRFVDRPSRFDTIERVGMPISAARRMYLLTKEPSLEKDNEIDRWVKISQGFSIAHLREMIIANRCFKQPIDKVVERLEKMKARQPTSEDDPEKTRPGFGFGQ